MKNIFRKDVFEKNSFLIHSYYFFLLPIAVPITLGLGIGFWFFEFSTYPEKIIFSIPIFVAFGVLATYVSSVFTLITGDLEKNEVTRSFLFNFHKLSSIAGLLICSLFFVDNPDFNFDTLEAKVEWLVGYLVLLFLLNIFSLSHSYSRIRRLIKTEKTIAELVGGRETKILEFKETFSVDVKKGSKESYIELESLKNVVAFLNSEGGDLVVGVSDDYQKIGIDNEIQKFYKNDDKFLLHVKNKIKHSIGEEFYPLINTKIEVFEGKKYLRIIASFSDKEVFLKYKNEQRFFVRTDPATDELSGEKLLGYIRRRFPK